MKILPALFLGLVLSNTACADDFFSLSSGLDYSSGKYGNASATEIWYIPVTGKYVTDDWMLKLTVPYISISGPGGVVQGMGRTGMMSASSSGGSMGGAMGMGGSSMSSGSSASINSNSGLGDVVASVGHKIYATTALECDLVGNVKFGTASASSGLGTGQNDYSMQLDGYYRFTDSMLLTTMGYKKYGSQAGVVLNDIWYGQLGVAMSLRDSTSAGILMNMAQRASTQAADQLDATIYISEKLDDGFKITVNLLKGFADGSPDFGGSVMLSKIY